MALLSVSARPVEVAKYIKSRPSLQRCDPLRSVQRPASTFTMAHEVPAQSSGDSEAPFPLSGELKNYEIRQLEPDHVEWVQAIVGYTMSYKSPIWEDVRYDRGDDRGKTQRAYDMFHAIRDSSLQAINSGLSYGVFDKTWKGEYGVTWDFTKPNATEEQLLEGMQFPLVSIAMSKTSTAEQLLANYKKEAGNNTEAVKGAAPSWKDILPLQAIMSKDLKDQEAKLLKTGFFDELPTGDAVRRSGTHTWGAEHTGKGLSRALAHYMMDKAKAKGIKWIMIHTGSDAINKVWENPPEGYKHHVTGEFNTANHREVNTDTEQMHNPFGAAEVICKRIWVDLQPKPDKK